MIWGALGAVLVRSILTLMVVWLLKFPGLLFVGGVMLVWGSSLLLRYLERFPALVYVGAAVLAVTAAKMMTSEPLVRDVLSRFAPAVPLVWPTTSWPNLADRLDCKYTCSMCRRRCQGMWRSLLLAKIP
jgi:predicted tellurium resistance membrane protein TerC